MEYDKIKEDFRKVIQTAFNIPNPKLDYLFEQWSENKKHFYEKMGGKYIYELPGEVCFEMNKQDKIKNVEDFVTDFEWENNDLPNLQDMLVFFEQETENFYSNITGKEFRFFSDDTGEEIVIPKGIKINKALKFFIHDKDRLTEIQNQVSRLIQKDKVNGKLCFSIHPLDYLSTSENVHNWRSCHALDGEYRMGGLSYMVDKSTVVCYLKSTKDDYYLPNFPSTVPWNSKKWRVLLHFSNDYTMMFAGRQYPFSSTTGMTLVLDRLLHGIAPNEIWSDWDNTKIETFKHNNGEIVRLFDQYVDVGGGLISMHELVKRGTHALNFNDILDSSYYNPYYSYKQYDYKHWGSNPAYGRTFDKSTRFEIGGPVKCFECEEDYVVIPDTGRCISCEEKYGVGESEDFTYCEDCGRRIFRSTLVYVQIGHFNGKYVCPDCADQYNTCEVCGMHLTDEATYVDEDGHQLCDFCRGR